MTCRQAASSGYACAFHFMKLHRILLFLTLIAFSTGCASFSSPKGPPPTPTPADQPIAVLNENQLPAHFTVVGTVTGYTIEMLQKRARKLGADAIINPHSVDPVSGFATTEAIKYTK